MRVYMAQTGINSREIIVNMLLSISAGEEYSHVLIRNVLEKYDYLDSKDKAFIKCVTEGCLERRLELDYLLNGFSRTPVQKMKPFIRELLRMSVYQLLYLSKVPPSAVINEAVKLAKKRGFTGLSGFVNAVLRKIATEGKAYPLPDFEREPVSHLSIQYSMPEWLVETFEKEFGKERTVQILQGMQEPRPVTIRFPRTVKAEEREQLLLQIRKQCDRVESHPYLPEAYCLYGLNGVAKLPGFEEGKLAVQDVSSMLAVEAAGIRPGDKVLDVCAAPGGKTAYAAMLTGETGSVEAGDVSAYKTEMIAETCKRLGLRNVRVLLRDATVEDASRFEAYDVVLADVPCLGLGVMGRKKEIRYRIQKSDFASITALQKKIVTEAVRCVKPGGTLLYSTCSMTEEENTAMVRYMEEELGLFAESLEDTLPESFLRALKAQKEQEDVTRDFAQIQAGYMQLLPGVHASDGFFFARMRVKNGK